MRLIAAQLPSRWALQTFKCFHDPPSISASRPGIMHAHFLCSLVLLPHAVYFARASPLGADGPPSLELDKADLGIHNVSSNVRGPVDCYDRDDAIFGPMLDGFNTGTCANLLAEITLKIDYNYRDWWFTKNGQKPSDVGEDAIKLPVTTDWQSYDCMLILTNGVNLRKTADRTKGTPQNIGWRDSWGPRKSRTTEMASDKATWFDVVGAFLDLMICVREGGRPGHMQLGESGFSQSALVILQAPLRARIHDRWKPAQS